MDSIDNETDEFTPVGIDRDLVLNLIQAQDDDGSSVGRKENGVVTKKTSDE